MFTADPSVVGTFYINAFYCPQCGSDGKGMMVYGEGLPDDLGIRIGTTVVGSRTSPARSTSSRTSSPTGSPRSRPA